MRLETLRRLEDIRQAAEIVVSYTQGKGVDDYLADTMLRDAVERRLEIIGEAVRPCCAMTPKWRL
jgi:uncharacterized protein with HEPN domain